MILEKIINKTKEDLEKEKKSISIDKLLNKKREFKDVKKFLKSTPSNPYRIIAEIKKASPSKGIIREDFNPYEIAKIYNKYADAMSILTEPHFFQGSIEYLDKISKFSKIPLLRKDFIIDEFQIAQSYYYNADFILLIATALDKKTLKKLYNFAKELNLEVLVEVHNKEDLEKALYIDANIIGFNHRDLKTFKMNMSLSKELIPLIPKDKIIVAESGINNFDIIQKLHSNGVDAFLIGEYFMKQNNIEETIKKLKTDV